MRWQKERKVLKVGSRYATEKIQTIEVIIAGESEKKEPPLPHLTETMKKVAKLNGKILVLPQTDHPLTVFEGLF